MESLDIEKKDAAETAIDVTVVKRVTVVLELKRRVRMNADNKMASNSRAVIIAHGGTIF